MKQIFKTKIIVFDYLESSFSFHYIYTYPLKQTGRKKQIEIENVHIKEMEFN